MTWNPASDLSDFVTGEMDKEKKNGPTDLIIERFKAQAHANIIQGHKGKQNGCEG